MKPTSKAVIVTGCSSGIGRATAERLAAGGWTVYATARRPESIADLEQAGCKTLALDVSPQAWPVGMGGTFEGVLDFASGAVSRPEGPSKEFLGTREAVTGYDRGEALGYFTEQYVPPRIIIAVAGNVTHDRVVELFSTGFQGFERSAERRTATPAILKPGVNIVSKTLEQVHLIMGFPGLHHSAPERYALFLLNDIIGGSMSSRLFQEVREREGLVYAIHSGVQAYVDTGTLYVYAATDEKNFSKVLKSTLKVLRELKKTGVTEEELRRAKDHLKGSLMLSLESTSSRMNRLAKHEMHHGTFLSMDAMLAAIDGVRHEEVQALVTEHLDEDRLALTTLGPLDRRNLPRELLHH